MNNSLFSEDESIDSAFARFNTILTSLKALDEGYSRKNYVRKFLRSLHPKRREKVTAIEESKDLTSLSLDEIIGNLKARKESSDEECSTSRSKDEEYAMAVRDNLGTTKRRSKEAEMTKMNQRAFVGGSWSDSGKEDDEKVNNKTCLVAQASSEELVPQPRNMTIIGTKWVFRNKLDKNVAILESIRILLAYAYALDFKLFQMDIKSAFLNDFINEEVYVVQPPGFIDFEKSDHVYKLKKALYGLKQAPKAWFDPKSYKGVFLGYSQNSKAYIILNKRTRKIEESLNVTFDETPPPSKTSPLVDDDLDEEEAIKITEKKNLKKDIEDETLEIDDILRNIRTIH
uniref:Reverse transcriptase Ty1/copia-type domain-containing protein n=1 Tax=Tanacetum cinerariifolium TaxID=118510 RepID=A0A6L2NM03_TANCI|nr:hypothetical protein [Tanacetum cinerariifolium]